MARCWKLRHKPAFEQYSSISKSAKHALQTRVQPTPWRWTRAVCGVSSKQISSKRHIMPKKINLTPTHTCAVLCSCLPELLSADGGSYGYAVCTALVRSCSRCYMTVQGIMQQLQSSPHQHPCLMGTLGPLEEEVEEVVDGGIVAVVYGSVRCSWAAMSSTWSATLRISRLRVNVRVIWRAIREPVRSCDRWTKGVLLDYFIVEESGRSNLPCSLRRLFQLRFQALTSRFGWRRLPNRDSHHGTGKTNGDDAPISSLSESLH